MGRRPRDPGATTNKPLAVFATVLVVAGIVGVAYISSMPKTSPSKPSTTTSTAEIPSVHGPVAMPQLLLVNDDSFSLVSKEGTLERLTPQLFSDRAKDHQLPYEGADVANGEVALFRVSSTAAGAPRPIPSVGRTYMALPTPPQADGTGVVLIARGSEPPQRIVLRDGKIPLKDAEPLGWFSDAELAVVATATSSRALYAVTTTGAPRFVAQIPDEIATLFVRAGAVWYTTEVRGEGLESESKGPSEVHRIDAMGNSSMLTRDELRVILSVVPDPNAERERIAYTTDDGQAFVIDRRDGKRIALGKTRPLLFLRSGELVVREGFDLFRLDPVTSARQKLSAVPEGEVNVFDATSFLDATP